MNEREVREYVGEVTESWLDDHIEMLVGMTQAEVLRALIVSLQTVVDVMEGGPS